MRDYPGYFITFEGPDGGGKTTHAISLVEHLRKMGFRVVDVREPGGNDISEQIRDVINSLKNVDMALKTESLLFLAARAQITEKVIRPALDRGEIVIADRFRDSTVAYQGYGWGLGCGWVDRLNDWVTNGLVPDLTLLLDVNIEKGLQRKTVQREWNRMDNLALDFHRKVREAYLTLYNFDDTDRWQLIDASRSEDDVFEDILSITEAKLIEHGMIEGDIQRARRL